MSIKEQSRRYYLKHRLEVLKKVRKYREKNRLKIQKRQRQKYANNKEYREYQKQYQSEWRKKNKELVRIYQRNYLRTHEKMRNWHNAWKRKWGKTPKGRTFSQLKGYRRRALLKDIGTHTSQEWELIKKKHGNRCVICKKKKKLTKDHIKPLTKGGRNTADNIQPLCLPCNARKGNKLYEKI